MRGHTLCGNERFEPSRILFIMLLAIFPVCQINYCETVNSSWEYNSDKCNFINNRFYWTMWEKL